MNATSTFNATATSTLNSTATTALNSTSTSGPLPPSDPMPLAPDGVLNVTVGPSMWGGDDNPVNSTCFGNIYPATRTCCDRLGGIINASRWIGCADNSECCGYFPNGTCRNPAWKYPICYLPTHMNATNWTACYKPTVIELMGNASKLTFSACNPPSAGVQYAVPVTLGFLAALAVSVLSM